MMATGFPRNGVKNKSILQELHYFNIISRFVPDAMHDINRGIAEQFLKYFINSSKSPYSLSKQEIAQLTIERYV